LGTSIKVLEARKEMQLFTKVPLSDSTPSTNAAQSHYLYVKHAIHLGKYTFLA
jgi:hypothetical protein